MFFYVWSVGVATREDTGQLQKPKFIIVTGPRERVVTECQGVPGEVPDFGDRRWGLRETLG